MSHVDTYPLKITVDSEEMDAELSIFNGQHGRTWYIKGHRVQSMKELSIVFGLDKETIIILLLKHGKPYFTGRKPVPKHTILKNIRKIADDRERRIIKAHARKSGRHPYHA